MAAIMRVSRRSKPYIVTEMSRFDFINFKDMSTNLINLKVDNHNVNGKKMCPVSLGNDNIKCVSYIYSYSDAADWPVILTLQNVSAHKKHNLHTLVLTPSNQNAFMISQYI